MLLRMTLSTALSSFPVNLLELKLVLVFQKGHGHLIHLFIYLLVVFFLFFGGGGVEGGREGRVSSAGRPRLRNSLICIAITFSFHGHVCGTWKGLPSATFI